MKVAIIAIATVLACRAFGQIQPVAHFVVPAGASNVDGNTYSFVGPAVNQPNTIRYQQVYAASEFSYLTNFGGGWLTVLFFRGDATNGTGLGIYMTNVQVHVSTTTRGPDQLSATFSDNVGTNDTVMYSGQLNTGLDGGHRLGPEGWEFEIPSSKKLFFYNPAKGNLLLDVAVFQGNNNTIPIIFDAVNVTNDSVSRVWGDVNATTGQVDTVGLPTFFIFWPPQELVVQLQTNSVKLSWETIYLPGPLQTVLQTTQKLSSHAQWQDITNGIVTTNAISTYLVPIDSAGTPAYFRLVSTSP